MQSSKNHDTSSWFNTYIDVYDFIVVSKLQHFKNQIPKKGPR